MKHLIRLIAKEVERANGKKKLTLSDIVQDTVNVVSDLLKEDFYSEKPATLYAAFLRHGKTKDKHN